MVDDIVPVYAFGRVYRIPNSQAKLLLENLDVPQPPCPTGWSRFDYGVGSAFGDECAVPTTLRDASMWWMGIGCILVLSPMLYRLHRRRIKGLTRTTMYHAISLATVSSSMWALWFATSVLVFDSKISPALVTAAFLFGTEYLAVSSTAFINNALDTMYSLQPDQAAIWHGRVSMTWHAARAVIVPVACYMTACIAIGATTQDSALTHKGVRLFGFAVFFAWLLGTAILAMGALGTGRAARALGHTAESATLRRKLERQRKVAIVLALTNTINLIMGGIIYFYDGAAQHYGMYMTIPNGLIVWLVALPIEVRRLICVRKQRGRRGNTVHVAEGPERRISAMETLAAGTEGAASVQGAAGATVPLSRRGVSLAFLRSFARQKAIRARMTTADVCREIVKPATQNARCAYYDLLRRGDTAHAATATGIATLRASAAGRSDEDESVFASPRLGVGRLSPFTTKRNMGSEQSAERSHKPQLWAGESSYFLSHTWSYRFTDLLAIIETFEEQTKPEQTLFYWFDIFVMNQHSDHDLGQNSLLNNLVDSIKGPGRVLLAMDSWREPLALTRVWCLLEVFTAMEHGAELAMCFSSAEQASFAEKLVKNQAEVHHVLEVVDAEKAEATVATDREMIFQLIRGGIGFEVFNQTIKDALRQSFARVVIAQRRL